MRKMILGIFISLISISASFAAPPQWTNGNQVISNIIWKPDYKGFYVTTATWDYCGCSGKSTGPQLYLLDPSITNEYEINRILSLLIAAKTNGNTVTVWVSSCGTEALLFKGLQVN
jgi:hypothetical protein